MLFEKARYLVPKIEKGLNFKLRIFGQRVKVAVETALTAADPGLVTLNEDVISIGGAGEGVVTRSCAEPVSLPSKSFWEIEQAF